MSFTYTFKILASSARSGGVGHKFFWVVAALCILWIAVAVAVLAALLPKQESQLDMYEEARCTTVSMETTQAFAKCERDRQVCVYNSFVLDVRRGPRVERVDFTPERCTDNAGAVPTEELLLQKCYKGAQTVGATYTCYTDPNDTSQVAFLHGKGDYPWGQGVSLVPYRAIAIMVPCFLLLPVGGALGAFCCHIHGHRDNVLCAACGALGHEDYRCNAVTGSLQAEG